MSIRLAALAALAALCICSIATTPDAPEPGDPTGTSFVLTASQQPCLNQLPCVTGSARNDGNIMTVSVRVIYVFFLPAGSATVNRPTDDSAIIDANNINPAERGPSMSLRRFPIVLRLHDGHFIVRGLVIRILNRLIEAGSKEPAKLLT